MILWSKKGKHHIFPTVWRPQASPHLTSPHHLSDAPQIFPPGGGVQRPARPGHRDRFVGSGPRHGGTAALRAADVAAPGQAAGHGGALGIGGAGVWWRRGDGGWNGRKIWTFLEKIENHHVFLDVFGVFFNVFSMILLVCGGFWSRDMLKHSNVFLSNGFLDTIL